MTFRRQAILAYVSCAAAIVAILAVLAIPSDHQQPHVTAIHAPVVNLTAPAADLELVGVLAYSDGLARAALTDGFARAEVVDGLTRGAVLDGLTRAAVLETIARYVPPARVPSGAPAIDPTPRPGGARSYAWWEAIANCESGNTNAWRTGYYGLEAGYPIGGMSKAAQLAWAESIYARAGDGAWGCSPVAWRNVPGG